MKIETQPQDNCTLKLTVEVDEEHLKPAMQSAARQFSKRYRIPGFRPGKAPYDVIVRQFGENALYETAVEEIGQKVYAEALEQEKIEPFGPGALEDVQLKPMVLTYTVPLKPEVNLGDYRAVRLPFTSAAIEEPAVQDALERLRESKSTLSPVERPSALGDVLALDVKGFMNSGENPSDFLLADENISLLLDEKTDWPMPGFALQLLDARAGDERKFDLSFAEEYSNQSLRGQLAHFEVKVKEVKSRALPEWDDELAKALGEYDSLDDLRAKTRADLENRATHDGEHEYEHQVVDAVVEQSTVKYPPSLLEEEIDDLLEDLDRRLREQRLTLDDYLKIENKTREALREEQRPRAEERLKRGLVLSKVVELERLTVSAEDVNGRIDLLSASLGQNNAEMRKLLDNDRTRQSIGLDMLSSQAVQRLAALARGEDIPLPSDEQAPEAPLSTPVPDSGEAPAN